MSKETTNLTMEEKLKQIKNGQNLDVFINDPEPDVRISVAEQGYGLDRLINDPNPNVRCVVAAEEYGLDILVNDPDPYVKQTAEMMIGCKKKSIIE